MPDKTRTTDPRVTGDTTPLAVLREKAGLVAVTCKCGVESVMAKERPADAKPAKCGHCGEKLKP